MDRNPINGIESTSDSISFGSETPYFRNPINGIERL